MSLGQAVLFIVVAVIAGYIFGVVDSRFTSALRKKTETPVSDGKPAPVEHNRPGEHTVLEVTVDKALKWHLELDGVRLEDPAAISPEQRQRAIKTIAQIRPWLDGKPSPAVPAVTAAPQPAPLPPIQAPLNTPTVDNTPVKISAMRGFGSMLNSEIKALEEKKPASIVTMINEVLQAQLLGTPLKDKGIKLEDGLAGGLIVTVGTQRYTSIDAVPEPEVRAAIKAAAAEWDKNR